MSNEKLVRMYSDELEYLCGKLSRIQHLYCYDKTKLDDFSFDGVELPTLTTIDLGLVIVHAALKKVHSDPRNNPIAREVIWPSRRKNKTAWSGKMCTQTFETYHLSLVQTVSFYTGVL
mgnify:CR=1 FL=1|tara:strand:+ start:1672 stop:2025 length:354 start_codon:yes stop_codon:yes gene_type:complete